MRNHDLIPAEYSIAELAALAGLSRKTGHQWVRKGYVRPIERPGPIRVPRAEVERVLDMKLEVGATLTALRAAKERRAARRKGVSLGSRAETRPG